MSLTSCHKAGATIRGLLGGTAVYHRVINTYTMASYISFMDIYRFSSGTVGGVSKIRGFCESMNYFKRMHLTFTWKNIATGVKLTLTSFYFVLGGGKASQMPTLVFATPSLWLCLVICLELPVVSLYTSSWGTVYSHFHPKCISSPSESPLISPSPVVFDLPVIWVWTAWGLFWLFVFSSAA